MAKAATIGALRVSLALDTAQFSQGVDAAQGALASFAKGLKTPLLAAGAAVAAGLAAVGMAIKSGIDRAADINDVAEATGIAVKELSRLAYAAKVEGIEIESLGSSLNKLSKNLAAVGRGEANDAGRALDALGISATNADGSLKNSGQIMEEVADKFGGMKDGANKAALAIALFGKSGAELIPLLNNGAAGIRQFKDEADALGLTIDAKTAKAADAFGDNLTKLGQVLVGLGTQIAAELLPDLVRFTEWLVEFVKDGSFAKQVADTVREALEWMRKAVVYVSAAWAEFARRIQLAGEVLKAFATFDYSAFKDAHARAAADIAKIWEGVAEKIAKTTSDAFLNAGVDKYLNSLGSNPLLASVDKYIAGLGKKTEAPALPDKPKKPKKDKADKDVGISELREEGLRLWEETRTPMEAFGNEVARLGILMKAGVIDTETYNRAVADLADQFGIAGLTIKDIGATVGESLSGIFDGLISGTFDAMDAIKSLLSDLSRLLLNSAFKQLSQQNGGASGGFLGSMFDSLANFASGGSFKVGGAGGIDSQLVAFNASPNETVSVTKPGQERAGGSGFSLIVNNNAPVDITAREPSGPDMRSMEIFVNERIDQRVADPYSGASVALSSRGLRNSVKRR